MLHTRFRGEEDLPYMGVAAILVMRPRCREQIFVPPSPGGSVMFHFMFVHYTFSSVWVAE